MGSIMNGLALCKLRPFGSTFLATWLNMSWGLTFTVTGGADQFLSVSEVFSDYMRPPIRLSAIMEMPCIFVFTHDSIGRLVGGLDVP